MEIDVLDQLQVVLLGILSRGFSLAPETIPLQLEVRGHPDVGIGLWLRILRCYNHQKSLIDFHLIVHYILMIGSPGAGKSMLAARLPSILPPLSPSELLEVSMIASVAGEIQGGALTARRPFRSPHHSASMAALTGGGMRAKPGEISLAHQGVLFLDELPEFDPRVLDSLRQPLENGEVSVSRANHRVTYPARFMLVAAMNPCRCGHAFEPGYSCKRGRIDRCTADYQMRISGPLMDRIDLRIEVPAVTAADLILPPAAEGSAEVAARVAAARDIQLARYAAAGLPHVRTNAEAPASVLEDVAQT